MLFHTHEFLALLALTALAYHWLRSARQSVLLVASLAFYAYTGLGMTALFMFVAGFNYRCLRWIEAGRSRWALPVGLGVNLLNLFSFKYTLFFFGVLGDLGLDVAVQRTWIAEHIVLPVGISFYTFQMMAVLIDASRGSRLGVQSLREFLLFVTFFGQLIAGPIMRGGEFFPQLHRLPGPSARQLMSGVTLFLLGVLKKVVVADALLAPRVDQLFADSAAWDTPSAWLLGILFGFQIYFDFSAYCDMALGLGRMFGLELQVNFATPYVSRTPSEFWSRWNITLSRWFGDYVYIPLGGSRTTLPRTVTNLMLTMLLSGLWHGAGFTFLIWGGLHGAYLSAYHALRHVAPSTARRITSGFGLIPLAGWAMTFVVGTIGWVFFRAQSVSEANAVVASMFGLGSGARHADMEVLGSLSLLLLALHFAEAVWWRRFEPLMEAATEAWQRMPGPVQAVVAWAGGFGVLGLTKQVSGTFIYFQF